LAILSAVLVAVFNGDTSRLIPLYAVGVFFRSRFRKPEWSSTG
jgi:hypothetical protein